MRKLACFTLLFLTASAFGTPADIEPLEIVSIDSVGALILQTFGGIIIAILPIAFAAAVVWAIVNFGMMVLSGNSPRTPILDDDVELSDDQWDILHEAVAKDRAEKAAASREERRRDRTSSYLSDL